MPGVRFAGGLAFIKNGTKSLFCSLLIIAGDIVLNPSPIQTSRELRPSPNSRVRKPKLSKFYANARSIVNKIDKLHWEIEHSSHDIVIFIETHLDVSILDLEILPPRFTLLRRDRQHQGRYVVGVLIAARNNIKIHQVDICCQCKLVLVNIIIKPNIRN